jgi:type I restriction enzyme R subunit
MTTDTTEKGLESLIMRHLTGTDGLAVEPAGAVRETPGQYAAAKAAGAGWIAGAPADYDRAHSLDVPQLFRFLEDTQPAAFKKLGISDYRNPTDIKRLKFLNRLSAEIGKHGVIHVLRKGLKHEACDFTLFFATPSPGNATAAAQYAKNRFSVTRQLRYSLDETRRALDLCLFINGLPIATFELKNSLTKQTADDAEEQYKRDRDPREKLFEFGRCVVHFAMDDAEVRMCTQLKGKASWFLPFNKGFNDGAGNPPNPDGLKTDYLWKEVLTPAGLTDILENYAQIVETKNPKTGQKKRTQIFPRYHQLGVARKILADASANGAGRRYLIQHSAGSGKSNSIAWLAHQLIRVPSHSSPQSCHPVQKVSFVSSAPATLRPPTFDLAPSPAQPNSLQSKPLQPTADGLRPPLFDSVIVVTDRTILDDQIQKTVKQFMQVSATVGHAHHSGDLRKFIQEGRKIIISTVQKFPFILDEVSAAGNKTFAIIIDEAHSSQGGKTTLAMSKALGDVPEEKDEEADPEDTVNAALEKRMAARKMLTNASYFAFTATPKNKTLEMFGEALPPDAEGKIKHRPFHSYTMKQAIQEGFILDVLANYTPVHTFCKLVSKVDDDPEFDTRKALKKLRAYVEGHDHAIKLKAEIMVDNFLTGSVGKINGQARAMIVCHGVERAIQYFHAFKSYLVECKSPYQAIVAFSGEHEFAGEKVTEASLNGFPSNDIADTFKEEPYRFLICADKFQTGYDEPLLHTMYVDKPLSGIKAVQTLSRLNRAYPGKREVFVLDFQNNAETITQAFADYYRTTLLSDETDPNKLHDLKAALDDAQVYSQEQVDTFCERFLTGAPREALDPILDACAALYKTALDVDGQISFKGSAKTFVRTYELLSALIPYKNAEWEKLSILLNLLINKLPSPVDEDLSKGIIQSIDMDSYRVEKKKALEIPLPDADAEINPIPVEKGGHKPEPEIDTLTHILDAFNAQFGTLFSDGDRVIRRFKEDIAPKVAADQAYQNAMANTPSTARLEYEKALEKVMLTLLKDDTQVYKQFVENDAFKRSVSDMVYALTQAVPPPAA